MNNKRRDVLKRALNLLENALGLVNRVLDEEQDSLDNTPENLMENHTADFTRRTKSVI